MSLSQCTPKFTGTKEYSYYEVSPVASGSLMMIASGSVYLVSVYTSSLQSMLDMSSTEIATFTSMVAVGSWLGIVPNYFSHWAGSPKVTALIGASLMLTGYLVVAFTSKGTINLDVHVVIFFGFVIGQGSAWAQVATTGANVSNTLPRHRGAVYGLLHAGNALSSGVFTQILQVFDLSVPYFLIVTGITMSFLVLVCYPSTHVMKNIGEKNTENHTNTLFIIPLALIMLTISFFVALASIVGDEGMHIFILVLFFGYIIFVVYLSSVMTHIYGNVVFSFFDLFDIRKEDKFELNTLEMSIYKNEQVDKVVNVSETMNLLNTGGNETESQLEPEEEAENTEGVTFWNTIKTYRFWLIFFTLAVGTGAGLTVLYNIAKIIDAHSDAGSDDDVHSSLKTNSVALFSAFNTAGRIIFGFLSDILLVRKGISRAWLLSVNCLIMAAGTLFMSYVVLKTFNYVVIMCAFSYGGFVALVPALIGDVFGSESYTTMFMVTSFAPVVGTELLYNWLSTEKYNEYKNESNNDDNNLCFDNPACFKSTFFIISMCCLVAFFAAGRVVSLTQTHADKILRD